MTTRDDGLMAGEAAAKTTVNRQTAQAGFAQIS